MRKIFEEIFGSYFSSGKLLKKINLSTKYCPFDKSFLIEWLLGESEDFVRENFQSDSLQHWSEKNIPCRNCSKEIPWRKNWFKKFLVERFLRKKFPGEINYFKNSLEQVSL